MVLSHHILDEMARILPRLSRVRLSPTEVRDLVDSFMFLADVVEPGSELDINLRDPAYQLVLATLKAAHVLSHHARQRPAGFGRSVSYRFAGGLLDTTR